MIPRATPHEAARRKPSAHKLRPFHWRVPERGEGTLRAINKNDARVMLKKLLRISHRKRLPLGTLVKEIAEK